MLLPDEGTATTLVIKLKPGWIYVKIAESKPDPERIELLLHLTIDHWFSTRPQLVIDRSQPVTEHGILQGINIWYHDSERQNEPPTPEPSQQPFSLTFEVHDQVYHRVPKEHIEALVEEALQICRAQQEWHGTLAVINPGRIAIIIDKEANRGALLPVELVYPTPRRDDDKESSNLAGGSAKSEACDPDGWKLVLAPEDGIV